MKESGWHVLTSRSDALEYLVQAQDRKYYKWPHALMKDLRALRHRSFDLTTALSNAKPL
jgi:hypothetical protein